MLTYGSATYTYRADGLRASDGTGSSKKYYLYDGGNAICRLDSSGNLDRTYVFAPDGLVGWSIPGSGSHQMLFDWQGNLEHSTSATGSVATSHAYNAWGQRNSVFPINAVTGANDRFGYNARWGYVRDTTGLYYCQNRYYDPANGRWLNRDPIGYDGGMNLYGYCGGGPVGAADPTGEIAFVPILIGVAILGLINVAHAPKSPKDVSPEAIRRAESNLSSQKVAALKDIALGLLVGKCLSFLRVAGARWSQRVSQGVQHVDGHHPFAQAEARKIINAQPHHAGHPAFKEVVPLERAVHRGKGGIHGQGYNKLIEEMINARGGYSHITAAGIDDIMKELAKLGLR